MGKHEKTVLDKARDELFSHIHRCGVLDADSEQQEEWMDDTINFMRERYPELTAAQTKQLRDLGMRFCQPVIPHGKGNTATEAHEDANAA
ncbi:MAG: hypothetical protein ACOC8B_04605 [Gemmatimonadota bacterium]